MIEVARNFKDHLVQLHHFTEEKTESNRERELESKTPSPFIPNLVLSPYQTGGSEWPEKSKILWRQK